MHNFKFKCLPGLVWRNLFLLLLIVSPGFWFVVFRAGLVGREWLSAPEYFERKAEAVFGAQRLGEIGDLRWAQVESSGVYLLFSKAAYNRHLVLIDEFFGFASLLSPRLYFQSGDGTVFSPSSVEPVASVLFPFWIWGVFESVGRGRRILILVLLMALFAYLGGSRSMAFLWPVMVGYVYLASKGLRRVAARYGGVVLALVLVYSLYLDVRVLGGF
jgi:hypothetical protein